MLETLAFPERINVEPTNRCNMRCRLCPHPVLKRPRGNMDPDLSRRIARECAPRGTTLWLQYMGEPLMHPRILEMIAAGREEGVARIGLSTNASLLDERMTEGLLSNGLDRLECSVDAVDPEGFRAARGTGDFHTVVKNIERFLAAKRRRGLDRPVTSLQYMAFTLAGEGVRRRVVAHWKDRLCPGDFIMSIRDYSFAGSVRAPRPGGVRTACAWPFRSAVILWDGSVVLCGSDCHGRHVLGDLNRESLHDVWNGEGFVQVRDLHRKGLWDRHALCAGCDDWALSDGKGYVNIFTAGEGEG